MASNKWIVSRCDTHCRVGIFKDTGDGSTGMLIIEPEPTAQSRNFHIDHAKLNLLAEVCCDFLNDINVQKEKDELQRLRWEHKRVASIISGGT